MAINIHLKHGTVENPKDSIAPDVYLSSPESIVIVCFWRTLIPKTIVSLKDGIERKGN
jgi:hypothetical protein